MSGGRNQSENRSLNDTLLKNFKWLFVFSIAANLLLLAMPLHMIAIYDRVQAFDYDGAAVMSAVLVGISLFTIGITYLLSARVGRRLS